MATRDAAGTAVVEPAGAALSPATAQRWLGQMLLIRRFEEKAAELYSAGKIRGFLHLSIGEEAVSVAAVGALTEADNVVSTYREHGHALARGLPPGPVMAELFADFPGPVLLGFPSGHTTGATITLPFGVACRVVAAPRPRLVVEESAVA
jgi:TPP-dependent pyruvate/acetoin dehydrogenase alpha subunit